MQILRDLIPTTENTAVALGYFDGVHLGHQKVIAQAVECKKQGLTPVVFTFSHTPKKGDGLLQLLTLEQRIARLEALGVEILYVIDFQQIKDFTPEEFVEKILKRVFNAKKVICGFNYHFGKNGAGDCETLKSLCHQWGIETVVTDSVIMDTNIISSTLIRKLLKKGDIEKANKYLGYDFGYYGVAVKGNQIGTKIGTPTINQHVPADVITPKFGVYASVVTIEGNRYIGVSNVGVKPTISGNNPVLCETWLPEYNGGDLYGKTIDTRLKVFIRGEKRFASLEELKTAIHKDGKTALNILK